MTLRSYNAVQRSIDDEHFSLALVPMPVDVIDEAQFPEIAAARKHLASLSPERRAALEAEWKQTVEYV